MKKFSRTPRGRAALAALAVGGGVVLVTGVTAAVAETPLLEVITLTDSTTSTTVGTTTDVTATTVITVIEPPPPPQFLPLRIQKTAELYYTRVNSWDIDKWAAPQAGWDKKDQSVAVDYSVKVTKSWKAEDIHVRGQIALVNPNRVPFVVQVGDTLPGGTCEVRRLELDEVAAAGNTPVPALDKIAPRSRSFWAYDCVLEKLPSKKLVNTGWVKFAPILPDGVGTTSTATAPPSIEQLKGYAEATAEVLPSQHQFMEVFPAVKVIDTLDGDQTRLLAEELSYSKTFTYKRYLSFWRLKKICRTWHNTAKITPAFRSEPVPVPVQAAGGGLAPLPEEWAKTDEAWVKICPPPAPVKGEDPAPPKVEVSPGPDDKKSDPVVVKPVDNPKGPVVKDNKSKGRLLVSKWTRTRTAQVGDIVTWNIKVKNIGKAELYGVKVVDLLPKHLVPVTTETENRRGVVFPIGDLAPGDSDVIEVSTRVVGKPVPTPAAINVAKRIKKAKDRDEALRRLRRGLVCNVVTATARKAASDSDIACIRIIKERPVEDEG